MIQLIVALWLGSKGVLWAGLRIKLKGNHCRKPDVSTAKLNRRRFLVWWCQMGKRDRWWKPFNPSTWHPIPNPRGPHLNRRDDISFIIRSKTFVCLKMTKHARSAPLCVRAGYTSHWATQWQSSSCSNQWQITQVNTVDHTEQLYCIAKLVGEQKRSISI